RRVLALPADRGLRVPVRLRGHRAGSAERLGRVDVPADHGRTERLRRHAGPGRGLVPVRPRRRGGAERPALPARHHGPRDQLGLRRGLARRAGVPGDAAVAARTSGRPPTTTPSTCCSARCAAWTARPSSAWTAYPPSTTSGSTRAAGTPTAATPRPSSSPRAWTCPSP